jgi:mevalonate kinase
MDWCGRSVISVAIEMRIFIEAKIKGRNTVEVYSYSPFEPYNSFPVSSPGIKYGGDSKYIHGIIEAYKRKNVDLKGMEIRFLKAQEVSERLWFPKNQLLDLPAKKGLSSSAALCVAVAGAVDILNNNTSKKMVKSPEKLAFYADMAYMAERKILGINCGQMDQYSSAFGGILHMDCYQEPPLIHPLKPNVDLPLVIGDTLQTKNTPKILGWLKERCDYKEPRFMEGVEEISNIVKEAKKELEKEKPSREKIGELMNLNQHYLSKNLKVSGDCPISPSKLDVLIDASLKAGALGAKLSGSGGGGTMVALCNSEDIEKVAKAIEGIGGKAYITHVAEEGFKIEQSSE